MSRAKPALRRWSVVPAFLAAASVQTPVIAQTKPQATLEEVVVTARRRSENLQETPVAITALGSDYLDEMGVSSIEDVESLSPSLQFSQTNYKAPAIFIRGIGQRSGNPVLDPGVGMYLNGVYVPRSDAQLLDAVDVANIQVLRGPQGTLFGKNNIGGALLVDSKKPNPEGFEMATRITAGDYGRKNARLSANVPWTDQIATRFALNVKRSDGNIDNVTVDHALFDEDRQAFSQRTMWYIDDTIEVDFFSFFSRIDERGSPYNCSFQNGNAILAQGVYRGEGGEDLKTACDFSSTLADDFKVSQNYDDAVYAIDNQMYALTLSAPVGIFDLESITSYAYQDNIRTSGDSDGTAVRSVGVGSNAGIIVFEGAGMEAPEAEREQFTQEFKFNGMLFDDRLNLTFGAFYAREELVNTLDGTDVGDNGLVALPPSAVGFPSTGDVLIPVQANAASLADYVNETRAVFAQGTFDVTEWLQLTLGVRYTEEERESIHTQIIPDYEEYANRLNAQIGSDPAIITPVTHLAQVQPGVYSPVSRQQYFAYEASQVPLVFLPEIAGTTTFSEVTPALTVNVITPEDITASLGLDSLIAYLTISDGFKSGGLDVRSTQSDSSIKQFEPELVTNTEIGVKVDAFDRRLRFNIAVFQLDYEDLQVALYERGATQTEVVQFTGNAGKAVVDGFELELTALMGNWTINANAGYTDGDLVEYNLGTNTANGFEVVDRSGEAFPQVPQNVRGLVLQYDWFTDYGRIMPSLQYYYSDEIFIGTDYLSGEYDNSTIGQYETFDARVQWEINERMSVTGYVNNIKDTPHFVGGIAVTSIIGVANRVPGQPRSFGVEFAYEWF